jgi:dienelactone hydrolase
VHQKGAAGRIYVSRDPSKPVVVKSSGEPASDALKCFDLDAVFQETDSTEQVFARACGDAVRQAANGINSTIMCYGMTGSGKTYTMFGGGEQLGIVGLMAQKLLLAGGNNNEETSAAANNMEVSVSFLQIYGKTVSDLLDVQEEPSKLAVRSLDNEIVVEGLSRRAVLSPHDIFRLAEEGMRNRATSKHNLNEVSSRSHAIMTFYVTTPTTCAKIQCVDLAGSERVKEVGAEGQTLTESKQINLSLFHLIRVVNSINTGEAHIPFSDSPLTFVLKDALGGNSKTVMIATVSPSQVHAAQTVSTLKFAVSCRKVKTNAHVNKRDAGARPWAVSAHTKKKPTRAQLRKRVEKNNEQLPWSEVTPGASRCPGGRRHVGGVSCLVYGSDESKNVAVLLHGYPSDAESQDWMAGCLVHAGYLAVLVDMPGCGESDGPLLKTRSEYNLVKGGPAVIVKRVLEALGRRSAVMLGYDWGGGVALSMAASPTYKHLVQKVVTVMPSYAEFERDELKRVSCPTCVMWTKDDNFHPWTKFKPLAKKLRLSLGNERYLEHVMKRSDESGWTCAERQRVIVKFLTGVDYMPSAEQFEKAVEIESVGVNGDTVVARQNVLSPFPLLSFFPCLFVCFTFLPSVHPSFPPTFLPPFLP